MPLLLPTAAVTTSATPLAPPSIKKSAQGHVQMCIEISPEYPVASVIGFLRGKSAFAFAQQLCGKERNFAGEHLRGGKYAASTTGFEIKQVRQYLRDQ